MKIIQFIYLGVYFQVCLSLQQIPNRSVWGNVNRLPRRGSHRPNRHKDPKWAKFRAAKVLKIALPDIEGERKLYADRSDDAPDKMRDWMKKQGILPLGQNREYPVYMGCTTGPFDAYLPPESDGKAAILSLEVKKVYFLQKR